MAHSSIPLVHQAALIANSRDILLVCELDGRLIAANEAFTRILGWTLETALEQGMGGIVHPEDRDTAVKAIAGIADSPMNVFTNRQRTLAGDWVWIEWTGQRDGSFLYFVGRDVTDRMDRERAHDRAHEHYVEAQLLGGVGHWRRDLRTGAVTWSEGVFAAFGLDPSAFQTEYARILDHVFPDDRAVIDDALRRIAETGAREQFEFRVPRPDGEHLVWADGRREDGPDGPTAVFGVVRDVTEERKRMAALDQARRDAVEIMEVAQAANAEKSRFLASMSHELRTPLNAIIGFSEMMTLGTFGPMPDRYTEYADHVLSSARFLLSLINDMLDLSGIEAGARALQMDPLDTPAIVNDCLAQTSVLAGEKGIALETAIPPRLPPLIGDDRAIRQLALNLLSNAIKFTPTGGTVRVLLSEEPDGGLCLTIADTGIGIAIEDQKTIFSAFTRGRDADALAIQGTGLGLALVKALADLHGASITLESTPGQGTTVSVRFPGRVHSRMTPDAVTGPV